MPNGIQGTGAHPGPPAGIDFVFGVGIKKVDEQMASVDSLDTKMGVLFGFLGALIAGVFAALLLSDPKNLVRLLPWKLWPLSVPVLAAGGALVFASLCFAFQAFRMRQYYPGLRFGGLVPFANNDEQFIKEAFLPTLVKAVELNEKQMRVKQKHAKLAVWCVFLALLALFVSMVSILIELL